MPNDGSIQLSELLRVVCQRWRLVALVVAVSTGVALILSFSAPKQYDATAQLLLRSDEPIESISPGSGRAVDPERELNTAVALIEIGPVAQMVQRQLAVRRDTDTLLKQIETKTSSTSDIVSLRARDRDPVMAARLANAFAEAYVRFRVESAREHFSEAAELAKRQLLELSPQDRRRTPQGIALQERQRDMEIAAALQTGGVELIRRASVPTSASRPRPKLSAALGLMLGLVLGLGAALLLGVLDRRFHGEREVEEFFGLPVLAAIPRPARRSALLDDAMQGEAFGLLASNLQLAFSGNSKSVVMITSPGPGESKTTTTIGVARAYARLGMSVVAIEADLRRPAFGRYADMSVSRGLSGVLAGGSLEDELVRLDAVTLEPIDAVSGDRGTIALLPAGTLPDNPQRVLSAARVGFVLDLARTLADVVIVDTAPIGTVNDAALLAEHVDGIAVVTRLNQTTREAARRAKRILGKVHAELLGVVVTDAGNAERYAYYGPPEGGRPVERAPTVQGGIG